MKDMVSNVGVFYFFAFSCPLVRGQWIHFQEVEHCERQWDCKIAGVTYVHTLCVTKSPYNSFRDAATDIVTRTDEKEVKSKILNLHNQFRNEVAGGEGGWPKAGDMRLLTWDSELEDLATAWANTLSKDGDKCRITSRFEKVGQNHFWEIANDSKHDLKENMFETIIKEWTSQKLPPVVVTSYKENEQYDNVARIVAGSTYRLGCAEVGFTHSDKPGISFVCNYGPQLAEKAPVYKNGDPCSKCSPSTKCSNTVYKNLCALPDDPTDDSFISGASVCILRLDSLLLGVVAFLMRLFRFSFSPFLMSSSVL